MVPEVVTTKYCGTLRNWDCTLSHYVVFICSLTRAKIIHAPWSKNSQTKNATTTSLQSVKVMGMFELGVG